METDIEVKLKNGEIAVKAISEGCIRCSELEGKCKKLKEKYNLLELDMVKKKSALEFLQKKLSFSEVLELAMEDEVKILKARNKELERIIENGEKVSGQETKGMAEVVDLTEMDEEDKVTKLMIENKVLECEKQKALNEAKVWEAKYKELELLVMELRGKTSTGTVKIGSVLPESELGRTRVTFDSGSRSPPLQSTTEDEANARHYLSDSTPRKDLRDAEEEELGSPCETELKHSSQAKKRLGFAGESPIKMAPSTPGVAGAPVGAIDISDSDDDKKLNQSRGRVTFCGSFDDGSRIEVDKTKLPLKDSQSRVLDYHSDEGVLYTPTPKRKRASNIVTSDSESDDNNDDDDLPICKLIKRKSLEDLDADSQPNSYNVKDSESGDKLGKPLTRRRLVRLGKIEENGGSQKSKYKKAGTAYVTSEGEETEEDDLESEGESLGGFIVNDSDNSEGKAASNGENIFEDDETCSGKGSSSELENASHSGDEYDEIISSLRRERKHEKWVFEADMLADFGKDPELCMMAVCALYRQQTKEEKDCKATMVYNGRGFSQCDAPRGSELAEFLTDGDENGEVKKSVEELQEYDREGVEICRKLATRYSKQLFEIYKNGEDPFFGPRERDT